MGLLFAYGAPALLRASVERIPASHSHSARRSTCGAARKTSGEIYREPGISQRTTWQIMRKVAAEIACVRVLWH